MKTEKSKLFYLLQLARPANMLTAVADVSVGYAASGGLNPFKWLLLAFSSACLYAGGIVLNDCFDLKLDAIERPERVLPSQKISLSEAFLFATILWSLGVLSSFLVSWQAGVLSMGICICAFVYNRYAKHHLWAGPFFMGLCRTLNLALGFTLSSFFLEQYPWILAIPMIYIATITLMGRGEVHGSKRSAILLAVFGYSIVWILLITLGLSTQQWPTAFIFIFVSMTMILIPWYRAYKTCAPQDIGLTVKASILGLFAIDACMMASFHGFVLGLLWMACWPLSITLSKKFAVT